MATNIGPVIVPVKDLDQAKALYGALLGTEPYADAPYYVGFRVGDQELGLDPHGHDKGLTSPVAYWEVDDINGVIKQLTDAGAQTHQEPTDVGGGKLIALLKDADGNFIGLSQN